MNAGRDHRVSAEFLHREFGAPKFADASYLDWYYDANPEGRAVCGDRDDERGRLATYALVPQRWRRGTETASLGITVDACVRQGAQRSGVFRELATEVFARSRDAGIEGTLTIANANSTPAFVEKLGLRDLGPLPVVATLAVAPDRQVESVVVDEAAIAELGADAAARTTPGWVHDWTAASLAWRLASPVGPYALHRTDELWCISTRSAAGPIPVAVILALLPRAGRRGVAGRSVAAAAARHHRAPVIIYAGRNADVALPGVPVPRRLLPSPLNLLATSFGERPTQDLVDIGVYEFLDTDHY